VCLSGDASYRVCGSKKDTPQKEASYMHKAIKPASQRSPSDIILLTTAWKGLGQGVGQADATLRGIWGGREGDCLGAHPEPNFMNVFFDQRGIVKRTAFHFSCLWKRACGKPNVSGTRASPGAYGLWAGLGQARMKSPSVVFGDEIGMR
jgi:hypothetical protein